MEIHLHVPYVMSRAELESSSWYQNWWAYERQGEDLSGLRLRFSGWRDYMEWKLEQSYAAKFTPNGHHVIFEDEQDVITLMLTWS